MMLKLAYKNVTDGLTQPVAKGSKSAAPVALGIDDPGLPRFTDYRDVNPTLAYWYHSSKFSYALPPVLTSFLPLIH
jgi:hypothetical protein